MDSSLEEVAKETESTRAFPTKTSFQEDRQTSPSQERMATATPESNHVIVDDGKRQKMESLLKRMSERCLIALWGYPHVKWEIENLSQITTTVPIFLQFNYFRQKYLEIASCAVSLLNNIWVRVEHSLMQKKE